MVKTITITMVTTIVKTTTITMVAVMVKTTTIITEVGEVEDDFLPVEVVDIVTLTKTATVAEAMAEVVVDGAEGEAIPDLTESRIIKTWTMMKIFAVPREAEMTNIKMKVVEMDKSIGIEMGEETFEMMEEEGDRMAEVADSEEAVAEDHMVDNNEEITAEAAAVVVATS